MTDRESELGSPSPGQRDGAVVEPVFPVHTPDRHFHADAQVIEAIVLDDNKVYAVPRRFDLATILVVTAAYGLLFATLRFFHVEPEVTFSIAGFIAFVGAAQPILSGGKQPRGASVVAGSVGLTIGTLIVNMHNPAVMVAALMTMPVVGGAGGYLAGAVVGGVFLVADYVRQYIDWKFSTREIVVQDESRHPLE